MCSKKTAAGTARHVCSHIPTRPASSTPTTHGPRRRPKRCPTRRSRDGRGLGASGLETRAELVASESSGLSPSQAAGRRCLRPQRQPTPGQHQGTDAATGRGQTPARTGEGAAGRAAYCERVRTTSPCQEEDYCKVCFKGVQRTHFSTRWRVRVTVAAPPELPGVSRRARESLAHACLRRPHSLKPPGRSTGTTCGPSRAAFSPHASYASCCRSAGS